MVILILLLYLVGPEVRILTKNYFRPEYWPIYLTLKNLPKNDNVRKMSKQQQQQQTLMNPLTSRRTDGGKTLALSESENVRMFKILKEAVEFSDILT